MLKKQDQNKAKCFEAFLQEPQDAACILVTWNIFEEVFKSFTEVKVLIPHCENPPRQVQFCKLT